MHYTVNTTARAKQEAIVDFLIDGTDQTKKELANDPNQAARFGLFVGKTNPELFIQYASSLSQ